jgi:hypothetical protein
MKLAIDIEYALVHHTSGPDRISLFCTNLKDAGFPYEAALTLDFTAAAGSGVEYVKKNFPGLRIQEISSPEPDFKFSKRKS